MCVMRTAESVVFTDCPPGPARAVDVDPQLVRRDLDVLLVGLLEHRDHVERRERRVPPLLRVERADPHQPVHAALGGQQPVHVRALHRERRGLDARLLAVLDVVDLGVEALALGPPRVHPQQHLGPVLRLRCRRRPR